MRRVPRWAISVMGQIPIGAIGGVVAVVALAVPASRAAAAEITDVASSFDPDNVFDFRFRLGYEYLNKTAAIKRERSGDPGQTGINTFKDLVYHQQRHSMSMRAEVGIFQDLALHVELPFVIDDQRSYEYDQRLGSGCIFGGDATNCVNQSNSSTTAPAGVMGMVGGMTPNPDDYTILPPGGYDFTKIANGVAQPFPSDSTSVFRGVKRGGSGLDLFDTINFGITWAALSQKRDDTKPTWTVALEYKLSIGNIMTFNRMMPDASHGVSDGLDHVVARTSVSHRFRFFDPYISFWFDYPFARRSDTLFFDYGPAAKNQAPQMSGGVILGLEGVPWERVKEQYKIAFDVNARISGKFDGRGYSEMWEVFASSPALTCDPNWNASCSPKSVDGSGQPWGGVNKYQGRGYTGLTTIENYAIIGAEAGVNVQAGKYVRFRAAYRFQHDQSHRITDDDVGRPSASGARVSSPGEYNPAFRPIINEVGRRYRVEDSDTHTVNIWGQMMF